MGEVWAGENISVGYKVAIKTMLDSGSVEHEVVARFKREAYILGKIRSDYVARVLDFANDDTYGLVLILDLIEGEVFSNTLKRTKLTVEEAIEVGADVVGGLVDLHGANIVHRDMKPSNIILQPRSDGGQRAIIVDFGVSRLMKTADPDEEITNITRADMALGTLEYMAPEQMLDSRNVTGASDLYAVGAMLYRAVMGHHAFGNLSDLELARNKLLNDTPPLATGRSDVVAKGFEGIISKALKRRPNERYKRAEDMLSDLLALRERMLHPDAPTAGRRPMASLIDDEATADAVPDSLPVELSASFHVDKPSSSRSEEPTVQARSSSIPSLNQRSTSAPSPVSTPSTASATPPGASATPPGRAPTPSLDLTPPPRSGVSTGLVILLVLAALIGGVAIGVIMANGGPAPTDGSAPSAALSAPSPASTPSAAVSAQPSAPATSADAGVADASGGDAARLDGSAAGAAAPTNAAAPVDAAAPLDAAAPFPRPIVRPGGLLPGAPGGTQPSGGSLPGGSPPPSAPPKPTN